MGVEKRVGSQAVSEARDLKLDAEGFVFELPDGGLADRLRSNGLDYVGRCHDWGAIGRALIGVYEAARTG